MSYSKPRKRKYSQATRARNRERNIDRDLRQKAAAVAKRLRRLVREAGAV